MSEENIGNEQPVVENDNHYDSQDVSNDEVVEEKIDKAEEAPSDQPSEPDENVLRLAQEKAGSAIAGQRKYYAKQIDNLKRENEMLRQRAVPQQQAQEVAQDQVQYDPNRMVFDPVTERYYSFDDPNPAGAALAAQIWHQQQAEKKSKETETKKVYEDLATKIVSGTAAYDGYEDALHTFQELGNNDIASALITVTDPAKIVNYLGKNPREIERLLQVKPYEVAKEIWKIEQALTSHKKSVSAAKAPVSDFGQPTNTIRPPEMQSYEEREAYWRKRINGDR